MDSNDLNLLNIGEGIVEELYEDGLDKILSNISDTDTNKVKTRKLVIEFSFEPSEETEELKIHISSRVNLAPRKGRLTRAYMGHRGGKRTLFTQNPRQPELQFKKAAGDET